MRFLAAFFLVVCISSASSGWSPDGHRIVCYVAEQLLPESKRVELQKIINSFEESGVRYDSFAEACTFANFVQAKLDEEGWKKYRKYQPRHQLLVGRKTKDLTELKFPIGADYIMTGLSRSYSLATQQNYPGQAVELFYLGHFMGDLHQPMTIAFKDDQAGEKVKVTGFYGETNLRRVWSTGILETAIGEGSWQELAIKILADIRRDNLSFQNEFSSIFAQETYDIATTSSVQYCVWKKKKCQKIKSVRNLTPEYQALHQPIVEQRLKMASVRLAGWLSNAIHWVE